MASRRITIFTLILIFLVQARVTGQRKCENAGKTPVTALPVCGNGITHYSSIEYCGGWKLGENGCGEKTDTNAAFFKFTCFKSGTLGFLVNPVQRSNYDWALFDITGVVPEAIYSVPNLIFAANWSSRIGPTGASPEGISQEECKGSTPLFSKMPELVENREYLLLVSTPADVPLDFTLEFKGGTAGIYDPTPPALSSFFAACGGARFYIMLSKKVLCSSISKNGSDWELADGAADIAFATGAGCAMNYDTDTIMLTLSSPIKDVTCSVKSRIGDDGNTLVDSCGNMLFEGQKLSAKVPPSVPPPAMDSVVAVGCMPETLDVVMKSGVRCASIAADGSDFEISGPEQVRVKGAASLTWCMGDSTRLIRLYLESPVKRGGQYSITLKRGTDGSTLLDSCFAETAPGSSISFNAFSRVLAGFNYQVKRGCFADTVQYSHPGGNEINSWRWHENEYPELSNLPAFERIYPNGQNEFRLKMSLFVSNGACSDSLTQPVFLPDLRVSSVFEAPAVVCHGDSVFLVNKSTGPIRSWYWNLGNGNYSNLQHPPVQFYNNLSPNSGVQLKLTVANEVGCSQSFSQTMKVYTDCNLAVPKAFTPNGDGLNDFFYPMNPWKTKDLQFRVFDRFGQVAWETVDWDRKWDGCINGLPAAAGIYTWMVKYTEAGSGKKMIKWGTVSLIR